MAQDPEEDDRNEDQVLSSHALDMVTLYDSSTIDADIEADVIRGLLDANGIPSLVTGQSIFPLHFHVMVPRGKLQEALQLLAEAQAGGPAAADAAEAESEQQ